MLDTALEASMLAANFLYTEARFLDQQRWHDWLALYELDAIYWVPCWRSEHELIEDPDSEISFIYYTQRKSLEERIARITSGKTVTAQPLPRTQRFISNVAVTGIAPAEGGEAAVWDVAAAWMTRLYDTRVMRESRLYGAYELKLVNRGGRLSIASKKIIVVNDRVPTVLDVYSV
jgi:benzoate/toluate 1,2-dioxygenase beta subunit